ncbi:MAG: ABC-F family ATP-binding cassette domain-containing protein [Spirochaetota bacterium]
MKTLQLQDISLAFGDRDILNSVSCALDTTTRAALAGLNGSGKSTLLKVICGQLEADSGTITSSKDLTALYLPQSGVVLKDRTVFHELESSYYRFTQLLEEKSTIENQLAEVTAGTGVSQSLLLRLHDIEEALAHSDYYHRQARITYIATGLGFSENDMDRPCSEFSGGWKMRIALGKILLEQPDILLLDEPTNYLDLEARMWLTDYLKGYFGGYMLVSHDRSFLDATIDEVYEIQRGGLTRFTGTYSTYEKRKEELQQQIIDDYYRQQREIAQTEEFINRFRYKASKAKQVQSRIKQLEKTERIELPATSKQLSFSFPPPPHSGKDHFHLEHVYKSYGSNQVLSDINLYIGKGERLAVTGKNGTGKTTLLRLISGRDTDYSGTIQVGTGVTIGYFAQETETLLNPVHTVIEEIEEEAPMSAIPSLRTYLGAFLFQGDDIYKQVAVLSGGEKSRLALLKILLHPANVLVLDEPTNHLDLASKDMLSSALDAYEGTVIFVSHDADFIKRIATKILYLSEEGAELFEGDYDYFSWKLHQKQEEQFSAYRDSPQERIQKPEEHKGTDYQQQNKLRNRVRTLERQELDMLHKIEETEQELEELNHLLSKPEYYADTHKSKEISQTIKDTEHTLEEYTAQWDALSSELEQLRSQYAG